MLTICQDILRSIFNMLPLRDFLLFSSCDVYLYKLSKDKRAKIIKKKHKRLKYYIDNYSILCPNPIIITTTPKENTIKLALFGYAEINSCYTLGYNQYTKEITIIEYGKIIYDGSLFKLTLDHLISCILLETEYYVISNNRIYSIFIRFNPYARNFLNTLNALLKDSRITLKGIGDLIEYDKRVWLCYRSLLDPRLAIDDADYRESFRAINNMNAFLRLKERIKFPVRFIKKAHDTFYQSKNQPFRLGKIQIINKYSITISKLSNGAVNNNTWTILLDD